jgi:hypothetical protein
MKPSLLILMVALALGTGCAEERSCRFPYDATMVRARDEVAAAVEHPTALERRLPSLSTAWRERLDPVAGMTLSQILYSRPMRERHPTIWRDAAVALLTVPLPAGDRRLFDDVATELAGVVTVLDGIPRAAVGRPPSPERRRELQESATLMLPLLAQIARWAEAPPPVGPGTASADDLAAMQRLAAALGPALAEGPRPVVINAWRGDTAGRPALIALLDAAKPPAAWRTALLAEIDKPW